MCLKTPSLRESVADINLGLNCTINVKIFQKVHT